METLILNQYDQQLFQQLCEKHGAEFVQSSFLRAEQPLVNTQSTYKLALKNNQGVVNSLLENKLDPADTFVATRLALGVYERNFNTRDEGTKVLQFYPNTNAFTAGAGFNVSHLNLVWNGQLALKRGTVEDMRMSTRRFLNISQTQQTSGTNFSSGDGYDTGTVPIPPIYINGSVDVYFQAEYNAILAAQQWASVTANTTIQLTLEVRGFILKGVNTFGN